jgi:hypothetical protein
MKTWKGSGPDRYIYVQYIQYLYIERNLNLEERWKLLCFTVATSNIKRFYFLLSNVFLFWVSFRAKQAFHVFQAFREEKKCRTKTITFWSHSRRANTKGICFYVSLALWAQIPLCNFLIFPKKTKPNLW